MGKSEQAQQLVYKNSRKELNVIASKLNIKDPKKFNGKVPLALAIVDARNATSPIDGSIKGKAQPPKILGASKQMPNATLGVVEPNDPTALHEHAWFDEEPAHTLDNALENAPPLELSEEITDELIEKEAENETYIHKVRSASIHFNNGRNEWKVIQKTYNNALGYQHMTMAMQLSTRGLLVCVMESLDNKTTMSTQYIDNGVLEYETKDGQEIYYIK